MKKLALFIPLILFFSLVGFFLTQLMRNSAGEDPTLLESARIGQPVPSFQLPDLFDESLIRNETALESNKPLLVNFWATWCPTCYAEHQFLYQLSQQGVQIIGINHKDNREKAKKWLTDLKNPYTITIFDQKGTLGLDLGVYGAPETFFIDTKGVIRYRHVGDINAGNWADTLQPIYQQLLTEQSN